jgi:hypothetical protein
MVARSLHPSERDAAWRRDIDLPVMRDNVDACMTKISTNRVFSALGLPELVSVSED